MSEGRKTRRFKETNEKAELDRQWKKISAVSLMKARVWLKLLPSALEAKLSVLMQIIEKRKKMEADG